MRIRHIGSLDKEIYYTKVIVATIKYDADLFNLCREISEETSNMAEMQQKIRARIPTRIKRKAWLAGKGL